MDKEKFKEYLLADKRRSTLTDEDLDKLSGIMIIGFSMAELVVTEMEQEYSYRYEKSDDYRKAVAMFGKPFADSVVHDTVVKSIRGDKRNMIGELLKAFKRVKYLMETLTKSALKAKSEETTEMEIFDAITNNINYWCYIYCIMSNMRKKEDFLKIESQIKLLAKDNHISDNVINLFKYDF